MTTDLYDIIGVPKTASQDDIKRAYRDKAMLAHPDKQGGSTSDMLALNRAYECLGDPERRALYDETGHDDFQTIEREARSAVINAVSQVIDQVGPEHDVLGIVRGALKDIRDKLDGKRSDVEDRVKKLQKHKGRVTVKSKKRGRKHDRTAEENLFDQVVDSKIATLEQTLATIKRGVQVHTEALKILEAYEAECAKAPSTSSKALLWSQLGTTSANFRWTAE